MITWLGIFCLYYEYCFCIIERLLHDLACLTVRELVDDDALANGLCVECLAVNRVGSDNLSRGIFCLHVLNGCLALLQVEVPCTEAV